MQGDGRVASEKFLRQLEVPHASKALHVEEERLSSSKNHSFIIDQQCLDAFLNRIEQICGIVSTLTCHSSIKSMHNAGAIDEDIEGSRIALDKQMIIAAIDDMLETMEVLDGQLL